MKSTPFLLTISSGVATYTNNMDFGGSMSYSMSDDTTLNDDATHSMSYGGDYKSLPFCTSSFFDTVKTGFEAAGSTATTADQAQLLVEIVCACDLPAEGSYENFLEFWDLLISADQDKLCTDTISDLADTVDAFQACGVAPGDLDALWAACPDYLIDLVPPAVLPYLSTAGQTIIDCLDDGSLLDFYSALCDNGDDGTCAADLVGFLSAVAGSSTANSFTELICGLQSHSYSYATMSMDITSMAYSISNGCDLSSCSSEVINAIGDNDAFCAMDTSCLDDCVDYLFAEANCACNTGEAFGSFDFVGSPEYCCGSEDCQESVIDMYDAFMSSYSYAYVESYLDSSCTTVSCSYSMMYNDDTTPVPSPTVVPGSPSMAPVFPPTRIPFPAPTFEPTARPTFEPTSRPTHVPSMAPNPVPTLYPTATVAPTTSTKYPTSVPVPAPTPAPSTQFPSSAPVPAPTMAPIPTPTSVPVPVPTSVPIPSPTPEPTFEPTPKPTWVPTTSPTSTFAPTTGTPKPTSLPIPAPTSQPTFKPSPLPSMQPTSSPPTHLPTAEPTFRPTSQPTFPPTGSDAATVYVELKLSANAAPTAADETNLKNDIKDAVGVPVEDIKNFKVIYTARRLSSVRRLLAGTWDVTFDIVASLADVGDSNVQEFKAQIDADLTDTSFTTAVTTNIPSVTSVDSVTSVGQTRQPSYVPVPAPTPLPTRQPIPQPTSMPIPAPTPKPTKNTNGSNSDSNAASLQIILIAVGCAIFVLVGGMLAYFKYARSGLTEDEEKFSIEGAEDLNTLSMDNQHSKKNISDRFANPFLRTSETSTETATIKHMDL